MGGMYEFCQCMSLWAIIAEGCTLFADPLFANDASSVSKPPVHSHLKNAGSLLPIRPLKPF